ncbi:MAG: hypothetical protein MJZ18_01810 [Bacteroidales bacterium]|nr:hypothetical protein [Bacteroidales bacterium]
MAQSYKEQLSQHVEDIFKGYSTPGLHICDIATGGGKSYTIGKLTCEYYPDYFDRIVILCVQNKLIEGMNREIERFIRSKGSKLRPSDKLVIENNPEVIRKAIDNGSFQDLLGQMSRQIGEQDKKKYNVKQILYSYSWVKKTYEGLSGLHETLKASGKNDYLLNQINEGESNLRRSVRSFFETFKKHLESTKQVKKVSVADIIKLFPALTDVYPQVEFRSKKLLIMTVHKGMYGVDPILTEKIQLADFADRKRTLILFDESDQAATSMRNAIIDQAIEAAGGNKRFAKGYNGYIQYQKLISDPENVSDRYHGTLLEESIRKAQSISNTNWSRTFKDTKPYNSIFLDDIADLENYRRGVFFSGPALQLNIADTKDKNHTYICYNRGERHFRLVHGENEIELRKEYNIVVPMIKFLSLVTNNTTAIKSQLRKVITDSLQKSRERFEEEAKAVANNSATRNNYLGYPTLEREIHTLLSRFESTSEYHFEQQMHEFITNRKNLLVQNGDDRLKLPDYSVYSQGVQLFQEEIDERDNQHRVRLSCREIATTPEKTIVDLASSGETSVVLCSATASSNSVVSNFDIKYLKQTLGGKVHTLSNDARMRFDDLVSKTYPDEHKIEVVPLQKYELPRLDPTRISLPEKYKVMFSKEAQEEGYDDDWLRITIRELNKDSQTSKNTDNISFQLYRLFQFIEAYHWFYTHDDIHSMLYFQNQAGDKNSKQFHVLSCLIDGSFKDYSPLEGEIPSDWKNNHIRISKDLEEVEDGALKELSSDRDAKIMLISAYGSFKAGANLQYRIPEGLEYIAGDNWETTNENLKKDWDAVFLQTPTSYLMMNEDGNEQTFEKSLYNAMLTLMMLFERGCLSKADVASWMYKALTNAFYFGEKNNPGIIKDKSAWAQTIVEQAVGRLCRTRNKPKTTYILFDESMTPLFDQSNTEKSLTKEFREFIQYVLTHPIDSQKADNPEEIIRCNDANYAQRQLDRMRHNALRFTPHVVENDDFDDEDDDENGVPHVVRTSQIMNQSYKRTIISKPVIGSLDELKEEDKILTFISKCYGNWERNELNEYRFNCDEKKRICPLNNKAGYGISPSEVRLDLLMKNEVIKTYFEDHGYATDWAREGLILHPKILATDYAGEIGEEAFKALALHYTGCSEDDFVHLEGKDYELADFVIRKADGTYKIAFDVKNMRPEVNHDDQPGDMPTTQKRAIKKERLGCEIITVNMLEIHKDSMDDIREINGMIKEDGTVILSAIERIKNLING